MPAPLVFAPGQQFGHLSVIKFDKETSAAKGVRHWLCRCRYPGCVRRVSVAANYLKSGHTRSCGKCLRGEQARKMGSAPHPGRPALDLTRRRFGTIVITGLDKKKSATTPKRKKLRFWEGVCDCGAPVSVRANYLISGHTASCGRCSYRKRARFLPSAGQKRAAWKAKEEGTDPAHGRVYSPKRAAEYLRNAGVLRCKSPHTLRRWVDDGCPHLGGEKPLTVLTPGAFNRKDIGYFAVDGPNGLNAIVAGWRGKGRSAPAPVANGRQPAAIAESAQSTPAPRDGTRKNGGRPIGSTDPVATARKDNIRADYQAKKFTSIAALARAHKVSRSYASDIVRGKA